MNTSEISSEFHEYKLNPLTISSEIQFLNPWVRVKSSFETHAEIQFWNSRVQIIYHSETHEYKRKYSSKSHEYTWIQFWNSWEQAKSSFETHKKKWNPLQPTVLLLLKEMSSD